MCSSHIGYCINFYRYHHLNNSNYSDYQTIIKNDSTEYDLLLGDFDLILTNPVSTFEDYRKVSEFSKSWIGGRQTLNVFKLEEDEKISTKINELDISFVYSNKQKPSFTTITCLNIANDIKYYNRASYYEFLNDIRNKILYSVDEYNKSINTDKIECEVYGCLGSTELVIVWLSEIFNIIPNIVDQIRKSQIFINNTNKYENVFSTSFCCVQLDTSKAIFKDDEYIEIQITENNIPDRNDLVNFLNKYDEDTIQCVGEFEYLIKMPAEEMHTIFQKNDEKLYRPYYYKNVLQHKIRLLYNKNEDVCNKFNILTFNDINCNEEDIITIDKNKGIYLINNATKDYEHSVRYLHEKLINELKSSKVENKELIHTLESLLCDYFRCMSISMNDLWYIDFTVQYKSVLERMEEITSYYNNDTSLCDNQKITTKYYLEIINNLVSLIVHQIYHQSQANHLVIDVPNSHQRYTGQHDLILHAYYGVVKHILETIYHTTNIMQLQSELHPFITVNAVPKIISHLYCELSVDSMSSELLKKRIVEINLPNDAMFNITQYIPYMIHEMYHYCSPYNRELRNTLYGIFTLLYFGKNILSLIIDSYIEQLMINVDNDDESDNSILYLDKKRKQLIRNYYLSNIFPFLAVQVIENNKCSFKNVLWYDVNNIIKNSIEHINDINNITSDIDILSDIKNACNLFFNHINKTNFYNDLLNSINIIDNTNIKSFIEALNSEILVLNINTTNFSYKTITEILDSYALIIEDDLREVFPDYAMVRICKMTISEYFIYMHNIDIALIDDQSIKKMLRIGLISYYFHTKDNKSTFHYEEERNNFVKLFKKIISNNKKIKNNEDIENEAIVVWKKYFDLYKHFENHFKDFYPIFDEMIESMEERFKIALEVDHINNNTYMEYYYKNYINCLLKDENNYILFKNEISCIFMMQKQEGLRFYNDSIREMQDKLGENL